MPGRFSPPGAEPQDDSVARLGCEVPNSEAPLDSHKPRTPIATQTHNQEQHWTQLEQFFLENERTIGRAEGTRLNFLDSEYGTTIDLFENTVTVVLNGLTSLARVHPVLGVAIFAFSAIVRAEMARRDNDKKVLAVKLQMQSMMCAMFQFRKLRHVHVSEGDREGEKNQLQQLVKDIADEITVCGSDLNYYTNRNTLSRVVGSKVYEAKFAGHIATFAQRRSELQNAATIYTAVGMDAANIGIASIGENVTVMSEKLDTILNTLHNLSSSRERQVLKFLEDNGGVDKCIDDDRLMNRLLIVAGEVKIGETAGSDARKEQQELQNRRKELKSDLKNLETAMSDNLLRFEKLLQIQSNNLESHFENQGNKIDQIGSNTIWIMEQLGKVVEKTVKPTGSLNDPVLKSVWDSLGLKGSVKAKHFILNFRDSIYKSGTPLVTPEGSPKQSIEIELHPTEDEANSHANRLEINSALTVSHQLILQDELRDKWALRYLTVSYVHPIIEAIDEDCSGYISIHEANKFAKARPPGTTLISWMAYWAVGWHCNITEYKNKIYSTILQMHHLAGTVHPHNQQLIKSYLNSSEMMCVEALLRSIQSDVQEDPEIKGDAFLKEYAMAISSVQEEQLTKNLDGIAWTFQSVNDVKVIANHWNSRVETWIMPVLYLVLTRHLSIFVLAQKHLLHTDEMTAHAASLAFILQAFQERLDRIIAIFHQVYRGHVEAHLKTFAYGMFFVFFKNETNFPSENTLYQQERSRYWETWDRVDDLLSEDPPPISILTKGLGKKFDEDGTDDEEKEDSGDDDVNDADEQEEGIAEKRNEDKEDAVDRDGSEDKNDRQVEHPLALTGEWIIRYSWTDALEFLEIKSANNGKITGNISAVSKRARITGDYKSAQGSPGGMLDIEMFVHKGDSMKRILKRCSALYDPQQEIITGAWVDVEAQGERPAPSPDDKFIARKIPFDIYFLRDIIDSASPPDAVDGVGPPLARRRWMYAIECVRSRTEARLMSKDVAVARVKVIRQLIKLHYESFAQGREGYIPEKRYRQMIVLGIPYSSLPHRFAVHKRLAKYRYERMLDNCWYVKCDNCSETITHVRYQCITCTTEKFDNQVDLCQKCHDADGINSLSEVTDFSHRMSHSLLRSTPCSWVLKYELAWLIPAARIASEEVKAFFRERLASINVSSSNNNDSVIRKNKLNRFKQCAICDKPISALPAYIRLTNETSFQAYDYDLLCTDCVQNKNAADAEHHFLLRVFNHVRVWWSDTNSTRLEEQMEEMESRINIGLDHRMKELESRVNDQIKALDGRVNDRINALEGQAKDQFEVLLSMMKLILDRGTA